MTGTAPESAQAQLAKIIAALDETRRRLARINSDLKLEAAKRKSGEPGTFITSLQSALKREESSMQALQSECDFLRWTLERAREQPKAPPSPPPPAAADDSAERSRLQADLSAVKAQLAQVLAQLEIEKGGHAAKLAQAKSAEAAMEERFHNTLHDALKMAADNLERAGRRMEADRKAALGAGPEPVDPEPAVMSYEELSSFKDDLDQQMRKIADKMKERGYKEQERLESLARPRPT